MMPDMHKTLPALEAEVRGDPRSSWGRKDIVKGLRLKGWTQAKAAQHLGLPYHQYYYALKAGSLEAVRDFVSKVLQIPPQVLWASRFPPAWRGEDQDQAVRKDHQERGMEIAPLNNDRLLAFGLEGSTRVQRVEGGR